MPTITPTPPAHLKERERGVCVRVRVRVRVGRGVRVSVRGRRYGTHEGAARGGDALGDGYFSSLTRRSGGTRLCLLNGVGAYVGDDVPQMAAPMFCAAAEAGEPGAESADGAEGEGCDE